MDIKDTIGTINDLIENAKDGEYGFGQCAEHATSVELKNFFLAHQAQRRAAVDELKSLVQQLGGQPDDGGSMAGALHRGWINLREAVAKQGDLSILEECERGEDVAKARYTKALEQPLPTEVRTTVAAQYEQVLRSHDEVKRLREQHRAAEIG